MGLTYAKIMQKQVIKSGVVISGGYLLIGMVIKGYCELNYIKLGNLFHSYWNVTVDERWELVANTCNAGRVHVYFVYLRFFKIPNAMINSRNMQFSIKNWDDDITGFLSL